MMEFQETNNSQPETKEQVEQFPKEKKIELIDQAKNTLKSMLSMSRTNEKIYNKLLLVYNWLCAIYDGQPDTQFEYSEIKVAYENIQPALNLINRLLDDKEKLRQQLTEKEQDNESLNRENRKLEKICQDWDRDDESLNKELARITAERNNFSPLIGRYQGQIETLQKELNNTISNYHQQIDRKNEEIETLKKENQTIVQNLAELEASKGRLLTQLASVKQNTVTHYDGTSDRPQHHVLTGEYKTLKEQYLDPLANSLFTLMATSNPELKQQRREKVNDIKADISAIVLIGGQAMMRGESTSSIELPSGMLNEMLNLFNRELGIFDPNQSPQVSELLTKAANLAQGKGQYSVPGKWEEDDFKQAIRELTEKLCQKLQLNSTTLNSDIQTEIQKAINNALVFIERTNLAEPAALLSLDKEGMTFNCDFYEAAKGYEDEGKVTKVIYPAYIVDLKAKVKAIVLTEPSTIIPQSNPDPAPSSTGEILSSTGSPSNSPVSATQSPEITENEKEKIRLEAKLEAKLESLINAVKYRLIEHSSNPNSSENCLLLATLNQITSLEIIQQIETELYQPYPNLMTFTQRVNELIN